MSDQEYPPFEVDQHITVESNYYAGVIGSQFFVTLRDKKKILGTRCNTCNLVYFPPRSICGRCFSKLTEDDIVEIGPNGTLETFTRVNYSEPVHPHKAPFIYGIIKLDGADTGMAHFIDEVNFNDLYIGMRVEPVFEVEAQATMLAIKYFKPLEE
jgi:uncharacterized OB-fold protein